VADSAKTPLSERIEAVCRASGYESEREWCEAAGYDPGYLATVRHRARNVAAFRLPEKLSIKLALVARVSVEWLRDGIGSMELPAAVAATVPEEVELAFFDAIRASDIASEDGVAARAIVAAGARFVPADRAKAVEVIERLLRAVSAARAARLAVSSDTLLWVLLGAVPPSAAVPTATPKRKPRAA